MQLHRRHAQKLSAGMIGVLAVSLVIGLLIFTRELPAMRRYLRIRRM